MLKNNNLYSILALFVAFGFAGAYVNGEIIRNRELRAELEAIKKQKTEIMAQVKQLNERTFEEEKAILSKISAASKLLSTLNTQRTLKRAEINEIRKQIDADQQAIEESIQIINEQSKIGFSFKSPVDTASNATSNADTNPTDN